MVEVKKRRRSEEQESHCDHAWGVERRREHTAGLGDVGSRRAGRPMRVEGEGEGDDTLCWTGRLPGTIPMLRGSRPRRQTQTRRWAWLSMPVCLRPPSSFPRVLHRGPPINYRTPAAANKRGRATSLLPCRAFPSMLNAREQRHADTVQQLGEWSPWLQRSDSSLTLHSHPVQVRSRWIPG